MCDGICGFSCNGGNCDDESIEKNELMENEKLEKADMIIDERRGK